MSRIVILCLALCVVFTAMDAQAEKPYRVLIFFDLSNSMRVRATSNAPHRYESLTRAVSEVVGQIEDVPVQVRFWNTKLLPESIVFLNDSQEAVYSTLILQTSQVSSTTSLGASLESFDDITIRCEKSVILILTDDIPDDREKTLKEVQRFVATGADVGVFIVSHGGAHRSVQFYEDVEASNYTVALATSEAIFEFVHGYESKRDDTQDCLRVS